MFQIRRIFQDGSGEAGGGIRKTHFRFQAHRIPGKRDGDDLPSFGGDHELARDRVQGDADEGQHRRGGGGQAAIRGGPT